MWVFREQNPGCESSSAVHKVTHFSADEGVCADVVYASVAEYTGVWCRAKQQQGQGWGETSLVFGKGHGAKKPGSSTGQHQEGSLGTASRKRWNFTGRQVTLQFWLVWLRPTWRKSFGVDGCVQDRTSWGGISLWEDLWGQNSGSGAVQLAGRSLNHSCLSWILTLKLCDKLLIFLFYHSKFIKYFLYVLIN